jgi:hypothetical protein
MVEPNCTSVISGSVAGTATKVRWLIRSAVEDGAVFLYYSGSYLIPNKCSVTEQR